MTNNKRQTKSKTLYNRLNFVLVQTAIELDMTNGEVSAAILKLMDSEIK